jgi:UDP-N-acetylglucosamine 2-epimerase (non-hydrolysing)
MGKRPVGAIFGELPVDRRTVFDGVRRYGHSPAAAQRTLFIVGTRPEAIKLAPVFRELSARPDFCCRLCVTGQHRELLAPVLHLFQLQPDWNLDIMRPDQDLAYLTGAALSGIDNVLNSFRPDRVIVQGDTATTFAGTLAAFYHKIPVAHVEAGLRTNDIYAPWPEEVNRRLVSRIADLHFAPTARARSNLEREGIGREQIIVTGNTGIDALLWVSELLDSRRALRCRGEALLSGLAAGQRLILMTGHRRESFDGGLARICEAIARIASRPDVALIFPVHPNPNVRRAIEPLRQCRNIRLVEPVDYPELVFLLKRCHFVVTDSGGIQEEAPSFGKPVLVTRCNTERPEAMELGLAKLVGNDERLLYDEMRALLDEPGIYAQMSQVENPYGDGRASRRIAARLSMETTPQRALSNPFNPDRHRAIARVES